MKSLLYLITVLVTVSLVFWVGITFRVTEQNPGGKTYTLNDKIDSRVNIPNIPIFEIRSILDYQDAILNFVDLLKLSLMIVLIPIGIVYIFVYEIFVNNTGDGFILYSSTIFKYLLYSIFAPIYFWFYLISQNSTFAYKTIWILSTALFVIFVMKLIKYYPDKLKEETQSN